MTLYLGKNLISGAVQTVEPSRNVGQIIPSIIPLKDAGLHLMDGALIRGGGIYNAFVDYIADLFETSDKCSNVIKAGAITDVSGVLSNFSINNFAQIPLTVPLATANTFDFVFKFTYKANGAVQNICAERNVSYPCLLSIASSGTLYCQFSNNHSSVNIGSGTGSTVLVDDNTYYVKLSFTGTAYKVYLSTTGAFNGEETEEISFTSSDRAINFVWAIGTSDHTNEQYPFAGSIDLTKSYIKINDSIWWYGIQPHWATTEAQWQSSIQTYGVCGKFVYDSVNNTVRLPKITGIVEGTTDLRALGDLIEAGLPDHTHAYNYNVYGWEPIAHGDDQYRNYAYTTTPVDSGLASASNSIYGKSNTVQPQSIKVLYYIVIATNVKTAIETDIDEVITDLNGKMDVDGNNATCSVCVESYVNGASWYRVYSNGWCEQGGFATAVAADYQVCQITFLKPFANTNYYFNPRYITTSWINAVLGVNGDTDKQTTGIKIWNYNAYSSGAYWYACGYIS